MLKKSVRELNLVEDRQPLPTIEIHADSVDEQGVYFPQIVSEALSNFVAKNPSTVATIYSYGTMSVNFHEHAWSEFLIVAGNAKVLKALAAAFARYPKVKSRYSDYIAPSNGRATYHLEDGRLWEVEDAFNWYSEDPAVEGAEQDAKSDSADDELAVAPAINRDAADVDSEEDDEDDIEDDEDDEGEDEDEDEDDVTSSVSAPAKRKGRLNVARADAKVSTIRRQIEKVFGLPEGSVVLCGPDKKRLKGNALIRTLRGRWEEN